MSKKLKYQIYKPNHIESDLTIEGISVGQSALQFYNANKIESLKRPSAYKDDSFYQDQYIQSLKKTDFVLVFY